MGISRDSRHKRRKTGGRMPIHQKKRAYEKARQPSNTKLGQERVHIVRCRGGNKKYRAMRLDHGNAVWASEAISRKTRILDVVYNATNNELVRTQTLTKGTVISIDAHPFQQWYSQHYGIDLGKKKEGEQQEVEKTPEQLEEIKKRQQDRFIDPIVEEQFKSGRLLAKISSRPGQVGRADSYILEGTELEFYKRKLEKKKK